MDLLKRNHTSHDLEVQECDSKTAKLLGEGCDDASCPTVQEPKKKKGKKKDNEKNTGVRSKEPEAAPCTSATLSVVPFRLGYTPLADRLNPRRAGFDAAFKARYDGLPKAERRAIVVADQREV